MPIYRASFPEGYPIGPPEELEDIEANNPDLKHAIESSALPLAEGEHDFTPATLEDVCKFYLFVHNDRKATLMTEPQCDNTNLEGSNTIITDAEGEGMKCIALHDPHNLNGRVFEAVFYSRDLL